MSAEFSIIIPTFNRAHLIGETINSFIRQSYTDWEIIVIDDGSTDNTTSVVKSFTDKRIHYFKRSKNHKKGPSGCRNYGLSLVTGKYVLFFDDDDIAHPDLLQCCLDQFQEKEIDFCRYLRKVFYNDFDVDFDRDKNFSSFKIGSDEDLEKMIINKLPFNTCAVVWKKSCFEKENFNEALFYSDEWECYQRLLSNGVKGISINKVLLFAKKHASSSTYNFLNSTPKYLNSTKKAMQLVIKNLSKKNKMTPVLFHFFIRNGVILKDKTIINCLLNKTDSGRWQKLKYQLGYEFYPLLKLYFIIKKRIKKI